MRFIILFVGIISISCSSSDNAAKLDSTLEHFLDWAIDDETDLKNTKSILRKTEGVTLEFFIYTVFTTPDPGHSDPLSNVNGMLGKMGLYVVEHRPKLSENLLPQLEKFFEKVENQTFMRGMLIDSLRAINEETP